MIPYLINITEKEFNDCKSPVLFDSDHLNRRFAKINGDYEYLVAWQSDLINLGLVEIKHNIYAIGVDQNFVILNFNINSVELKLDLLYNFLEFIILKNRLLLITELLIIELDNLTHQVIEEYSMPDIVADIMLKNDEIVVTCLNDEIILLN